MELYCGVTLHLSDLRLDDSDDDTLIEVGIARENGDRTGLSVALTLEQIEDLREAVEAIILWPRHAVQRQAVRFGSR
jgi:hypothetical protein